MVSYTYKDSIFSSECLAYWSRWLEVLQQTLFDFWQLAAQAEKWRFGKKLQILQIHFLTILNPFNPILKQTYLIASFHCFGVFNKFG